MKEKLFNKIVKKDYNNNLEKILSRKDFSEDYNVVKRDTFNKQEYIEKLIEIIKNDCDKIEFISKDNNKQEKVDSSKKEIVCMPIENKILYSIAKVRKEKYCCKLFR